MVPNGWKRVVLQDITQRVAVGLATSVTSYYRDKGVPIIRNLNIKKGYFDDSDMLYLDEDFSNNHLNKRVKAGDVITVHTGSNVGLTCVVPEQYHLAQTFTTLITTPKIDKLDSWFLNYVINSKYGEYQALRLVVGGGKGNLNTGDFKKYPVLLPPLPEQQKIAKILTTWDKAINTTERLIDNSKQQKKALMQQLLTGQKRLLDDSGQRFSGDWKYLRLDKVCTKITDGAHHSPKSVDENGYPMYSVKDMSPNGFKKNTARHISKEDYEYLCNQNCRPEVNDILIAKDGSILKHCFILKAKTDGVILSSIALLRPNTNLVFPEFIAQYFSQEYVKFYVGRALTSGSGVPRIILKDFKGIKIQYPSLEEQQKIATVLTNADKEIEVLEQQLADLQQEKKALMQQLLTGKKRVKVDK